MGTLSDTPSLAPQMDTNSAYTVDTVRTAPTLEKYEIPTHLHVEDKLLGGLTVRQVLYLSVGLSLGYALWLHVPFLTHLGPIGVALRVALSALPVGALLICGFAQPTGRPLEEWVLAAARYAALPKVAVWRSARFYAPDMIVDGDCVVTTPAERDRSGAVAADHPEPIQTQDSDGDDGIPMLFPYAPSPSSLVTHLRFRFQAIASDRGGWPPHADAKPAAYLDLTYRADTASAHGTDRERELLERREKGAW